MGDVENPRVQGHAAAAVSNFVENCPKKKVVPYLEMILCTIQTLMANNLPNVSCECLVGLYAFLSVCIFVCLSVCLSICLSVC